MISNRIISSKNLHKNTCGNSLFLRQLNTDFSSINIPSERHIPRLKMPSKSKFFDNILKHQRPVIYKIQMNEWKAFQLWRDPTFWKNFNIHVPVDIGLFLLTIIKKH